MPAEPGDRHDPATADRVIRVFVSSTFRDMRAERDELVKFVFPKLRRLCESRGVVWGDVDLRWGITEEQKDAGRVLPICLAEVRRCRPFCIVLLGERYGWVPPELPGSLVARESWLEGARGRSATELEILHGVLNDPGMAAHAFFYFREPAYVESLPEGERDGYREVPLADEIAALGGAEAARLAAVRRENLARLKDRIRRSGFPVRERYPDPRDLGRLVLEDMTRLIDGLYPEGETPDLPAREAAGQEACIKGLSRVFVGRRADLEALDRHAASSDPPLIVTGEPGCGKSALLASWVEGYRKDHPEVPVIAHFALATSESVAEAATLRRLAAELDRALGLGLEAPSGGRDLRSLFSRVLMRAGERGRAVIVIDGLERIEGRSGLADGGWLPEEIPPAIRLVIGCSPEAVRQGDAADPVVEVLARRGWPFRVLAPLGPDDRRAFIRRYLELSAKTLSAGHEDRIVASELAGNPLFLRTLVEELRQFGSHEELEAQLAHYLEAPTVPALFSLVLDRFEGDYERDRPGLVRDAFSLFFASETGLTEAELLDLLGDGGAPLPQAVWAPLFLAAETWLADRGGILTLNSPLIRVALVSALAGPGTAVGFNLASKALAPGGEGLSSPDGPRVWDALMNAISGPAALAAVNKKLADYFGSMEATSPRRLEMLPYLLRTAGDTAGLHGLMSDLPFVEGLVGRDLDAAAGIWEDLEREGYDFFETYGPVFKDPVGHVDSFNAVFLLMTALDHVRQSVDFGKAIGLYAKFTGDDENAAIALNNVGVQCQKAGRFEQALEAFDEAAALGLKIGNRGQMARSFKGRSEALRSLGELDRALGEAAEAERLYRELDDRGGIACVLLERAGILESRGDLDGARPQYEEAAKIFREGGEPGDLIAALFGLANLARLEGRLDLAEKHLAEVESLLRRGVHGYRRLGAYLSFKGALASDRGRDEEALRFFVQAQDLGREHDDIQLLAKGREQAAAVLYEKRDFAAALDLYKEVERAAREIKRRDELLEALLGQARCLHALKDTEGAARLYGESEEIASAMGLVNRRIVIIADHASLFYSARRFAEARALWVRLDALSAGVANAKVPAGAALERAEDALLDSRWDDARRLIGEAEARLERSPDGGLAHNLLSVKARLAYHDRKYGDSLALYSRMGELAREHQDRKALSEALGGQAMCRHFMQEDERAVALLAEAAAAAREAGRMDWAVDDLRKRGRILTDMGRLDDALAVGLELAEAGRQTGEGDVAREALMAQFGTLFKMNRLKEAASALDAAERLCREAGDVTRLRMALNDRSALLQAQGREEETIPALTELAALVRDAGDQAELVRVLGPLATALYNSGRQVEGRALLVERESLARALGDARALADTLLLRAWDLSRTGDQGAAVALDGEAAELLEGLGDREGLRNALLYLAEGLHKLGRFAEAASRGEQAEKIDRAAGRKDRLQVDLALRAASLWAQNMAAEAVKLYEEQESILREAGAKGDLAVCLSNQGILHRAAGNADKALRIFAEAEKAAREAQAHDVLSGILANWSEVLLARSSWDEALDVWGRAEKLAAELKDERSLWYYLYVQAHTLTYRKRDPHAALAKLDLLMTLPKEAASDPATLNAALEMRAQVLAYLGRRG